MGKLLSDIFSMKFDIIIPLSSSIIAVLLAAMMFSIRYFTYRRKKRKFEKQIQQEQEAAGSKTDTE